MSVSDGEKVNAAITNAAFVSRTTDSNTTGKLDLENADVASGSSITNVQKELNGQASFVGDATNGAENRVPTWASDVIGTANEPVKDRVESVQARVEQNTTDIATKVDKITSTDDAVVRFDGTSGDVQDSGVTIDDSDNVTIPGDLTVNGTTTTVNTATLDVADANITINDGGNDATSEGAGLTVERTSTDGSLVYEDALTSKFKCGALGSEIEIVTTTASQTITSKDIDLTGTASATNRAVMSSDTTVNLTSLSRKKGAIYFDDTTSTYKGDDGTSLISLGGGSGSNNDIGQIDNLGLDYSVAASALTVALKVLDGTTDPSGGDIVTIAFRSTPDTAGGTVIRTVSSSLSVVVPSGATLGHGSGSDGYIYIYAIDNAGTVELAVSSVPQDESVVQSTTAITAASDDSGFYSTAARSNVAIRLIGRVTSNQTTAGTWAALPTSESLRRLDNIKAIELIESSSAGFVSYGITVNQFGDLTSIDLPPGEWDISALTILRGGTGFAPGSVQMGISTTAGNSTTGLVFGDNRSGLQPFTGTGDDNPQSIPFYNVVVTTETTHYLKYRIDASIGSGTDIAYKISARRIK